MRDKILQLLAEAHDLERTDPIVVNTRYDLSLVGEKVGDEYHVPVKILDNYELRLSDEALEAAEQLVYHFLNGDNIQDLDKLNLDYAAIYDADTVLRKRAEYGVGAPAIMYLARILVKYEYSSLNAYPINHGIVAEWHHTHDQVIISGFSQEKFRQYCQDTGNTWWGIKYVKAQMVDELRPVIASYLRNNVWITDDKYFTKLLGAIATNQFRVTSKADYELSMWVYMSD